MEKRKFQFSEQSIDPLVGAIIDRPRGKMCVFALDFGEFVTMYRGGRWVSAPTFRIETSR